MYILHHFNAAARVCRGGLRVKDGSISCRADLIEHEVAMRQGGIARHNGAAQLQTCNISLYRNKRAPIRGFP